MRKTNLDEFPQFWNVLIGNMSVIGPRPEREYFIEQFKKEIPNYKGTTSCKIRHYRLGTGEWVAGGYFYRKTCRA